MGLKSVMILFFLEDATATNSKNLHYVSDSNKYNIVMNDY
jgi:hypothetical protein